MNAWGTNKSIIGQIMKISVYFIAFYVIDNQYNSHRHITLTVSCGKGYVIELNRFSLLIDVYRN